MGCLYPYPLKIAGIGRYLPEHNVVSNDLDSARGQMEGWCKERLGVLERRWNTQETPSFMGAEAAKEAVSEAGIDFNDLDLIINASMSFERRVPEGASLIQRRLGLNESGIPCITLSEGCQSFLAALVVAASLIAVGRHQNILIISSEIISTMLDPKYPEAYLLFGDGAAAVVVTGNTEGSSLIHSAYLHSYGGGLSDLQSLSGFTAFRSKISEPEDLALQLNLDSFVETGITYIQPLIEELCKGYSMDQLGLVIPQQAGKKFFDYLTEIFSKERLVKIFDRFGLCGAASYPMALYEAVKTEKLKRGNLFLMLGFGAGPSVGGIMMTY